MKGRATSASKAAVEDATRKLDAQPREATVALRHPERSIAKRALQEGRTEEGGSQCQFLLMDRFSRPCNDSTASRCRKARRRGTHRQSSLEPW